MTSFAALLLATLLVLPNLARAASFTPLGDLPGEGGFESSGSGVSADGSVVVGSATNEAFRWSGGAMVGLGTVPGVDHSTSYAHGVSADGSVVVGESFGADPQEPFRWSGGTMTGLGSLDGQEGAATDVSADGAVVVGYSGDEAFRWADGVMTGLGLLPNGTYSEASGTSADGAVVVGTANNASDGAVAFRWTNGVMSSLTDFQAGMQSVGSAVSADGAFVVGRMGDTLDEAFRWTEGELLGLGFLPGGFHSSASAVSANGTVVVGYAEAEDDNRAFVWTEANGMQRLFDVLVANGATGLEGWLLVEANAVSADGRWITGVGRNPDGFGEAFLADISSVPAPATSWLLGSALAALACARRRTAR